MRYCSVDNCYTTTGSGLPFFSCPRNEERCKKWRIALGYTGNHRYANITAEQCNKRVKICSLHFTKDSFTCKFGNQLTPTAIPSLNLSPETESQASTSFSGTRFSDACTETENTALFDVGIQTESYKIFSNAAIQTEDVTQKVCADTPLPLLDAMLQSEGDTFSDAQIFKEMFLFSMAATDTSGYTLAYTFTLLGMHKQIQENVYQEVMFEIGHNRPIYYEDLPNLKYTERAILEAMRILPVTPISGRLATDDIDVGTKVIPKGTNIVISILDLHRNEKYWSDPLKYDPDRFLPEEVAKRDPYTYIPFSAGPRNCIGKRYAMMLMKTAVANVVRNYEISSKYKSVDELELTSFVTMKTTHPLDCRFKPRMYD